MPHSVETPAGSEPLAIVGMACRLPGANGLDEYWKLLIEGRHAIRELPASRLDRKLYDPRVGQIGKTYSQLGAILAEHRPPRAGLRLSPADLENADLTYLELCEVAAEAFRHAKLNPERDYAGRGGVYVGYTRGTPLGGDLVMRSMVDPALACLRDTQHFAELPAAQQEEWLAQLAAEIREPLPARRSDGGPWLKSHQAARLISQAFGLNGPSLALNAACSSSLMGLAFAANALRLGDIDLAVVAGASYCKSDSLVLFSKAQSVSGTGSRPFDARADGLVVGEGYVVVLVQTLARALAEGNPIHAVIRGIGLSSDGKGKSLWAPKKEGQLAAMRRAYPPELTRGSLQYVEAHATSTPLGDATEVESLAEALQPWIAAGQKIPIGSVKANIGHTLEAAGLCGLIKTVLAMHHGQIPPVVQFEQANPKVDWQSLPLFVPTAALPWPDPLPGDCRRAGVNAFGIGGLNAHVVVEQYLESARRPNQQPLSLRSRPAVTATSNRAIAIVGLGVIAPGARTLDAFWQLLKDGRDPKQPIPKERWDAGEASTMPARNWIGGFVDDFEFDWRKHRVPPKQVAQADPLQFMVLDAVAQALHSAGWEAPPQRERTSVIVGNIVGGEFMAQLQVGIRRDGLRETIERFLQSRGMPADKVAALGEDFAARIQERMPALWDESGSFTNSTLASRVTKAYDLMGGACTIDSGNLSSFLALDVARNLLLCHTSDLIICAAGQRDLGPDAYEELWKSGRLAEPANGMSAGLVPGEGAAVLLLKRLDDAKRDRDRIFAIIRELGVSRAHDPQAAQQEAINGALERAGIQPAQISALHLSATGVVAEDHTELAGVSQVYAGPRAEPLQLNTLAGQIGHLGGAAGLMSLVKSALSLQELRTPASLPLPGALDSLANQAWCSTEPGTRPLPAVGPAGQVLTALHACEHGLACHVVLERTAPVVKPVDREPVVSSQESPDADEYGVWRCTGSSLAELVERAKALAADGSWNVPPAQATDPQGRFGLAFVHQDQGELRTKAKLFVQQHAHAQSRMLFDAQGIYFQERLPKPLLGFVFPGQGSQYAGMLKDLVMSHAEAAAEVARLDAVLHALQCPQFDELIVDPANQLGTDVLRTQLALLAAEAVMWAVVKDCGIRPDRITAHSYGEFPALYAAGAWDFRNAVLATLHRCRSITESVDVEGAMMQCDLSREAASELCASLTGEAFASSCNAAEQTVIAGTRQAVHAVHAVLEQRRIRATLLSVPPTPFHTPLLRAAQEPFRARLREIQLGPPSIPVLSSCDNRYVADPEWIRGNLVRQLVRPVPYVDQIRRLAQEGVRLLIEIGPGHVLTRLNQRILSDTDVLLVATDGKGRAWPETRARLDAAMHAAGIPARDQYLRSADSIHVPPVESRVTMLPAEPRELNTGTVTEVARQAPHSALRLLELTGTPYAMGEAHGRAMAAGIQRAMDKYAQLARSPLSQRLPCLKRARDRMEQLSDEAAQEELRGIAEASGAPLDAIVDHNLYSHWDLGAGCTQLVARDNSDGRGWLQAANEDLPLGLFLRETLERCVQVRRPAGKLPHVLFSAAGHCAGINGVNSRGVVVTSSMLLDLPRRRETLDGLLHAVLVRRILESAESLEAAVEIMRRERATGSWGVCLSDTRGNSPVYVEYDGRACQVATIETNRLVTNHAQLLTPCDTTPEHSLHRLERLKSLWQRDQDADRVSRSAVQTWLRDRFDTGRARQVRFPTMNTIRRVDNQVSLIIQAGAAKAWVTAGPYTSGGEDQFIELDLEELIGLRPIGVPVAKAEHTERETTTESDQGPEAPATEADICTRFSLQCVPGSLPTDSETRSLAAGAVVLGGNRHADALVHLLQRKQVRCLQIRKAAEVVASQTELAKFWQAGPATTLFLMTAFDADALATPTAAEWARRREAGLFGPYQLCQRWFELLMKAAGSHQQAALITASRLGGLLGFDHQVESPEGGFATGLAKALHVEQRFEPGSAFRGRAVDFEQQADPEFVADRLWQEAVTEEPRGVEVAYQAGQRYLVRPAARPIQTYPTITPQLDFGRVWVVTGGARGVTAEVARALGQQLGVKLHIVGSSPLPQLDRRLYDADAEQLRALRAEVTQAALARGEVPAHAWASIQKGLEIDKNLRSFSAAGLDVTYHSCDVGQHAAVADLLEQIRRQDGPLDGIVHGAGYEKAGRFPNKKRESVERTIAAKVEGAISLLELTRHDPLKFFVAFGSISGRFGGVGQSDYCIANELLCKLVAWLRRVRPEVRSTVFDWHSWGEVGMAVRPESKHAKVLAHATFMPVAEGVRHCLDEIRRGCPEAEVLITDWRRYQRSFPAEARTSQPAAGQALANPDDSLAARTQTPTKTAPLQSRERTDVGRGNEYAFVDRMVHEGPGAPYAQFVVDPRGDVFLAQHQYRQRPLLPLVAMIEAFAATAQLLPESPGEVGVIENLRVHQPLRLFRDEPHEIRVHADRQGDHVACQLRSDFTNQKGQTLRRDQFHAEATVVLRGRAALAADAATDRCRLPAGDWLRLDYPAKTSSLEIGPIYQCLDAVLEVEGELWGRLRIPDPREFAGRRHCRAVVTPSVLIDACLFTAGIFHWRRERVATLPVGIDELHFARRPETGELAYARVRPQGQESQQVLFDVELYDARGELLLRLVRYRAASIRR